MTMPAKNESHQMRNSAASASLRSARSLTCGTRNGGGSGVWRRDTVDRKGDWLWQRQRKCGGLQEGEYAALGAAGALVRVVHAQGAVARAQPMREVHM
jgi:hypothetical protein